MSRRWCEVRPPLMILLRLGFHHGIVEAHVKEFHEHVESSLEDPLNCANIGWSNNRIRELEERWSVHISFFRYLTYNYANFERCSFMLLTWWLFPGLGFTWFHGLPHDTCWIGIGESWPMLWNVKLILQATSIYRCQKVVPKFEISSASAFTDS